MTQKELNFDSIGEFVSALKEAGITKIAFAVVSEKRSIQKNPELIEVESVHTADALAYKSPALYRFCASGDGVGIAETILRNAGFDVTRRDRNIT